jgi:AcrR family transcriptional regulator
LTLESIASEAGVTPQAAYRYFGDVDDLILLAVRRVEASEHERLLGFMMVRDLDSEADLANAAVAFVIRAYLAMARAPRRDQISHRARLPRRFL